MIERPEKCVFVANRLPWPLTDGWARRTFHVIGAISGDLPVDLFVLHAGSEAQCRAAEVAFGGRVRITAFRRGPLAQPLAAIKSLVGSRPIHSTGQDSRALHVAISERLRQENVKVWACAGVYLSQYMPDDDRVLRVIDTHNIDSVAISRYASVTKHLWRRWFTLRTAHQLEILERESFARADLVLVCSEPEVALARERAPRATIRVVPNGVDLQEFQNEPASSVRENTLLFFGRLDYFPNSDAIAYLTDEVMAPLLRRVPDARVRIVGTGDASAAREAARGHPAIDIIGEVPNIATEILAAAAVIVPLRVGGGTRLKIVEAMGAGRPIVSTTIGAEGLAVEDGVHVLLRDNGEAFADAAAQILQDPRRFQSIGLAAKRLAESTYSWQAISESLRAELRAKAYSQEST